MWYYPCGQPRLINFFRPILFLASDSFREFHRGISHFFTVTKNTTERVGEEQTNKHGLGSVPSARKGVLWRFCAAFRAFVDYRGRVFCAKLLQKTTRNANSFFTVFPHCLLLLTVRPLDSVVDCPCLLSELPFLLHFRSHGRSRVQALCFCFAPKQTKRSSAWRTTHIVSQHSFILKQGQRPQFPTCQTPCTIKHVLLECKVLITPESTISTQIPWRTYLRTSTWMMFCRSWKRPGYTRKYRLGYNPENTTN